MSTQKRKKRDSEYGNDRKIAPGKASISMIVFLSFNKFILIYRVL